MVSLTLLGRVSLVSDGRPVHGPAAQRRRLALLSLLAAAPEGGVSREKLIGVLWPDGDSDQARRFLADSIYAIRKALGQDSIVATGDNLALGPAIVRSDVAEFRAAVHAERWEDAVGSYGGAFLDGFHLPDAPDFGLWADAERAELARQYAMAVERLARDAEARGDHVKASARWRDLQIADPLNSRIAMNLATALEASGDRAAALRHVEAHNAMLAAELGIGPDPALTALGARLRSSPAVAASSAKPARRTEPPPQADEADRDAPVPHEARRRDPTGAVPGELPAKPAPLRPRRLRMAMVALVLVGVGVALGAAVLSRRPPVSGRERVTVGIFENRTGDTALAPLGRMAADWIARGLMQADSLEVVSPTWTLDEAGGAAQSGMSRPQRTGTFVTGAYYRQGGALQFHAQILDSRRGELLQAIEPVQVPGDSGVAGLELLRQRVASALAARYGGLGELREISGRTQPPVWPAYVEYLDGVQLFSRFRVDDAARRFERAWMLDTTFHLARLYSMLTALNTGNRRRADSLMRELTPRRERMAAFDRALLEAFQADLAGDLHGGVRAMRTVAAMAPESQFVVGYAVMAIGANRPREALAALRGVDPDVGLLRDNPRYWEWLTVSLHLLGDHRRELREARSARELFPGLHGPLVQELRALAALGRTGDVARLIEASRTLPAQSSGTTADAVLVAAAELRAHGDREAAARLLAQAIEWYRDRPVEEQPRLRLTVARMFYESGRWDEARAAFETLAAERPGMVAYQGYLGVLAARRDDAAEAERISSWLASEAAPGPLSARTIWRARIALLMGERQRALQLLGDALSQGAHHGIWLHADGDLDSLRRDPAARALFEPGG